MYLVNTICTKQLPKPQKRVALTYLKKIFKKGNKKKKIMYIYIMLLCLRNKHLLATCFNCTQIT